MTHPNRLQLLSCILVVSLAGCGDLLGTSDAPHDLWIGQTGLVMQPGDSTRLTALGMETRNSLVLPPEDARWWSGDESVVRLSDDGVAVAVAPGRAAVWIEVGAKRDSATVVVLDGSEEPSAQWQSVDVGEDVVCAVRADGMTFCWGTDYWGQLGDGLRRQWTLTLAPKEIVTAERFASAAAGSYQACGLRADGHAFCWGDSEIGAVGSGSPSPPMQLTPHPVAGGHSFATLIVRHRNAAGLKPDGRLYAWGTNISGQIGDGTIGTDQFRYAPVPVDSDERFVQVAHRGSAVCALTEDGRAFCWGSNHANRLGVENGETAPQVLSPRPVRQGSLRFVDLAMGVRICGLTAEGSTYCWPGGGVDEFPSGDPGDIAPRRLEGAPHFSRLIDGHMNLCGLTAEGRAFCWGDNGQGELGTDQPVEETCKRGLEAVPCTPVPLEVAGNHRFRTLSSAARTTCGITLDDELYCWGSNFMGRLGAGMIATWGDAHWPHTVEAVATHVRVADPL